MQYAPEHYRAAVRRVLARRVAICVVVGTLALPIVLLTLSREDASGWLINMAAICVAGGGLGGGAALLLITPRQVARRAARTDPGIYESVSRIVANDAGVASVSPHTSSQWSWGVFTGVLETPEVIALVLGKREVIVVVPKPTDAGDELTALRALVAEHVARAD